MKIPRFLWTTSPSTDIFFKSPPGDFDVKWSSDNDLRMSVEKQC